MSMKLLSYCRQLKPRSPKPWWSGARARVSQLTFSHYHIILPTVSRLTAGGSCSQSGPPMNHRSRCHTHDEYEAAREPGLRMGPPSSASTNPVCTSVVESTTTMRQRLWIEPSYWEQSIVMPVSAQSISLNVVYKSPLSRRAPGDNDFDAVGR